MKERCSYMIVDMRNSTIFGGDLEIEVLEVIYKFAADANIEHRFVYVLKCILSSETAGETPQIRVRATLQAQFGQASSKGALSSQ